MDTASKDSSPLLSVRLMTFNHEKFVAQAIDGCLNQRTDFNFEIVIGDDFSTDNTLEIVKKYQENNPHKIRVLSRTKGDNYWNQRQRFGRLYNFIDIVNNCRGKYIALLDGDDFWTDPNKLQRQVDLLKNTMNSKVCFHRCIMHVESDGNTVEYTPNIEFNSFNLDIEYVLSVWRIATASIVFEHPGFIKFPDWLSRVSSGDIAMVAMIIGDTKMCYLDEIMSVYRLHKTGESNNHRGNKFIRDRIYLCESINKFYKYKYEGQVTAAINYILSKYSVRVEKIFSFAQLVPSVRFRLSKLFSNG